MADNYGLETRKPHPLQIPTGVRSGTSVGLTENGFEGLSSDPVSVEYRLEILNEGSTQLVFPRVHPGGG